MDKRSLFFSSFLGWQVRGLVFAALIYIPIMFILMPGLAWLKIHEWRWVPVSILFEMSYVALGLGSAYGAGNWLLGGLGLLPEKTPRNH